MLKEKYDKVKDEPSYCLDCDKDPKREGKNKKFYINIKTGICQENCKEKSGEAIHIPGLIDELCYTCGRGCEDCKIQETERCLSCSQDFYFQNDTKKYLLLTETTSFKIFIYVLIGLISICLIVVVGVVWAVIFRKKAKNKKLTEEEARMLKKAKRWEYKQIVKKRPNKKNKEKAAAVIVTGLNKILLQNGLKKIKLFSKNMPKGIDGLMSLEDDLDENKSERVYSELGSLGREPVDTLVRHKTQFYRSGIEQKKARLTDAPSLLRSGKTLKSKEKKLKFSFFEKTFFLRISSNLT